MKQAEDLFTQELPELGDSLTTHGATTPAPSKYRFYVTTREGATTEWAGLTRKQARDMNAYTSASNPWNIVRFGWGEVQ